MRSAAPTPWRAIAGTLLRDRVSHSISVDQYRTIGGSPEITRPPPLETVGGPLREALQQLKVFLSKHTPGFPGFDGILVVEQQQNRMAERGIPQTIPIEANAFGAQPEFAGQVDEARHRQGIPFDQIAAADGADFGIDPVLRAEAKETSERGLAGNDVPGSTLVGYRGAHLIQPLCRKEREWEEPKRRSRPK